MKALTLVTEDLLSEILLERLVLQISPEVDVTQRLGRKGITYIQRRARSLNEAAAGMKIVVLADRDRTALCPVSLIAEWLGAPRRNNLVIRFAEMEVESWIMADSEPLSRFLDVPPTRVPSAPDRLADPKRILVNIARGSRSSKIRQDVCPAPGSTATVGPGYNDVLADFVRREWRLLRAMRNSPSLSRAERRIRELIQR